MSENALQFVSVAQLMSIKEQLHGLVERLPEEEGPAAVRYMEFLIAQREPPVDPEMLARIDAARRHRSKGIPHEEILREFGL
jgi:hypothetical protein